MTTRVTIKNEDTSGHSIAVTHAGTLSTLKPGESLTTHVWAQSRMTVVELPIVAHGAMPPDPSYIGMTAEEYLAKQNAGS